MDNDDSEINLEDLFKQLGIEDTVDRLTKDPGVNTVSDFYKELMEKTAELERQMSSVKVKQAQASKPKYMPRPAPPASSYRTAPRRVNPSPTEQIKTFLAKEVTVLGNKTTIRTVVIDGAIVLGGLLGIVYALS